MRGRCGLRQTIPASHPNTHKSSNYSADFCVNFTASISARVASISYSAIPVATAAFKDSTSELIGMETIMSHVSRTSLDRPLPSAPVTKTADFTVATGETWLINNKSGSTCTVTLPTASTNTGRVLYFQNYQAQTLVSASSNVVPIAGGSAATAILADVAGDTATLVSDGANWIMTQYVPNNVLLLE